MNKKQLAQLAKFFKMGRHGYLQTTYSPSVVRVMPSGRAVNGGATWRLDPAVFAWLRKNKFIAPQQVGSDPNQPCGWLLHGMQF